MASRDREKSKTAEPQFTEAPGAKNIYLSIDFNSSKGNAPASYVTTSSDIQKRNEPRLEQTEKLRKLKEDLKDKRLKK